MDQQRFDIWLRGFESNSDEPGPAAVSRVFHIPEQVAAGLLGALPRVVRRDAEVLQAQRIVAALEAIGGRAEMVACPLRPSKVLVVGETRSEQEHADERERDHGFGEERRTDRTLRLGTQELAAFGLGRLGIGAADTVVEPARPREVTVREVEAPSVAPPAHAAVAAPAVAAMPWHSLQIAPPVARTAPLIDPAPPAAATRPLSAPPPATAYAAAAFAQRAALELEPIEHNPMRVLASDAGPSSASFVVTRDLRAWMDSSAPAADAPRAEPARLSLVPSAAATPTALELELDMPRSPAARVLTALPSEDALPPASELLRRPGERSIEARRPLPSAAPPAPVPKLDSKRVLESIRAPLQIAERVQASGWRSALASHPKAGFVLVLSSTALVFWLIELGIR